METEQIVARADDTILVPPSVEDSDLDQRPVDHDWLTLALLIGVLLLLATCVALMLLTQ